MTLKSQYALIQSAITKAKNRDILLQNQVNINSLDSAKINIEDEELFKNILPKAILSTTINDKEYGHWAKISDKKYLFFTQSKTFEFIFENNQFLCVSNEILCKEIE
ncbi:hypothetical protein AFAEC_0875 [Aliarcobacter faecis]|uniref:hypothetical protein n=1 Tax=Aliarcobacter faecis TaxID=1564138 RepID=UPI0004B6D6FE|nr:hypothetical protein [Aliarcobacter faecis]QKF73050.1 hypothetical protein AFAEC_0875 [Aliarcobacter faecis]